MLFKMCANNSNKKNVFSSWLTFARRLASFVGFKERKICKQNNKIYANSKITMIYAFDKIKEKEQYFFVFSLTLFIQFLSVKLSFIFNELTILCANVSGFRESWIVKRNWFQRLIYCTFININVLVSFAVLLSIKLKIEKKEEKKCFQCNRKATKTYQTMS